MNTVRPLSKLLYFQNPLTNSVTIYTDADSPGSRGIPICFVNEFSKEQNLADAQRITKCVNLHDELVSELENLFNESLKARLDSNCVTPHNLKINDLIKRAKDEL